MFGPDEYPEAEKGDFIPGIFNYCDRWCERCPMTMKCRQYAMEATMEALDGELETGDGGGNAEFWKRIDENLEKTLGMIDENRDPAEFESGAGDSPQFDAELDEEMEREEQIEQEIRKHPLALETMNYLDRVDPWFEKAGDLLKGKGVDLESRVRRAAPAADTGTESRHLNEAADVILWYHMQIHIKLQRALGSQRHEQEEDWEFINDPEWRSDADGSAKVALIGIDRSLSAWGDLREGLEGQEEAIFEILLQLDRIRRLVERQFPKARAFKRTGFDE